MHPLERSGARRGAKHVTTWAIGSVGIAYLVMSGGCRATGIGDPCVPEGEFDPAWNGFDLGQVSAELKSYQCDTRLCLVNHFQGRVSCPYGQNESGTPPPGQAACTVPGTDEPIVGAKTKTVKPQCLDRRADHAVYCSCRCANVDGRTDDGANYCACPDGFQCEQLIGSIGPGDQGLTGAYCIKSNTKFEAVKASCHSTCDPTSPAGSCD